MVDDSEVDGIHNIMVSEPITWMLWSISLKMVIQVKLVKILMFATLITHLQ